MSNTYIVLLYAPIMFVNSQVICLFLFIVSNYACLLSLMYFCYSVGCVWTSLLLTRLLFYNVQKLYYLEVVNVNGVIVHSMTGRIIDWLIDRVVLWSRTVTFYVLFENNEISMHYSHFSFQTYCLPYSVSSY